jgi:hypothetical protein
MFNIGRTIQRYAEGQVEQIAENFVTSLINATPLGPGLAVARRVSALAESGGMSEVERLLSQIRLPSFQGRSFFDKLGNAILNPPTAAPSGRRRPKWTRGGWARSRQEWLDEGWRHDWRSQPRDMRGRWIPGRLDYPLQKKLGISRRGRKIRRFRKIHRQAGRNIARGIVASWGRSDGN